MLRSAVDKTVLENGVRVITRPMPHLQSVSMGVWVAVGARDELPPESGLSHFIEHMIFKGTRRRTAFEIASAFDSIGGHTNAFTSTESTCYHAKVMDTHLETMVDILTDIFLDSTFDPAEMEHERPVILQEIGMVEDSPEEYTHMLAGANLWGDHPLGRSILGSRENVSHFKAENLHEFFTRFYQPERIIISAAGNVNHERIVNLMGRAFAGVTPGGRLSRRLRPTIRTRTALHRRDLEQTHICLAAEGLAATDPQRFAYSLLNTILGGNMSSRLFQEIRERRGLAYSVYSFAASHEDSGMFGVYAGVGPESAGEVIERICSELQRLGRQPVSEQELRKAKEFTRGNLLLSAESNDNQMARMAQNEIHFGRHVPISELLQRIEAVTTDDILALSGRLLHHGGLSLTMLGQVPEQINSDLSIGP